MYDGVKHVYTAMYLVWTYKSININDKYDKT